MPDHDFDYEAALHACAAGEQAALQRLYQHEGPRLLGVVKRLVRDHALAEDIVHDACLRIWTRAASFDPQRGSARSWIYSIARHLALNARRDGGRELTLDDEAHTRLDALQSLAAWQAGGDALLQQVEMARIGHCLQQLEPVRRQCIVLAYVEGHSHSEIAQVLQAPLGTVKAWITRSLKALRECLS